MLHSMTGFGRAVKEQDHRTVAVEIRSLNSKFLDLNLRFPTAYRHKEPELRNRVSQALSRGKVDITVSLASTEPASGQYINKPLAKAYFKELQELQRDLGTNEDLLSIIFRLPDVVQVGEDLADDAGWDLISQALEEALAAVDQFRLQEGAALEEDLRKQVTTIQEMLEEVKSLDGERKTLIRDRLEAQIKEWIGEERINGNRFEEELIYYLEKMDISEEKVRLENHCKYFMEVLDQEAQHKGKQLNFISQEMGREINTIGSKAAYSPIQKLVVQMKDALEKIKEQVLNIV